ncbi:MAG: YkgJ family cysteine cluster protein [Lachnospiraceae bacterium]|nr:YkgJ family cysteine cluster protein [Lachnospiraceae bacterium]
MQREIDLKSISDGRLYTANDMVRTDTGGCSGCSGCCRGMGTSVVLDPYDVWRIARDVRLPFERLLHGFVELNVQDGLILPNLAMNGSGSGCAFLDENDRCKIHAARPGFCRLFPMGRIYEDGDFKYFLQIYECDHVKTKVKLKKWLDQPELSRYEDYIRSWHSFWLKAQEAADADKSGAQRKQISLTILEIFFMTPWDTEADFYPQFDARRELACEKLGF